MGRLTLRAKWCVRASHLNAIAFELVKQLLHGRNAKLGVRARTNHDLDYGVTRKVDDAVRYQAKLARPKLDVWIDFPFDPKQPPLLLFGERMMLDCRHPWQNSFHQLSPPSRTYVADGRRSSANEGIKAGVRLFFSVKHSDESVSVCNSGLLRFGCTETNQRLSSKADGVPAATCVTAPLAEKVWLLAEASGVDVEALLIHIDLKVADRSSNNRCLRPLSALFQRARVAWPERVSLGIEEGEREVSRVLELLSVVHELDVSQPELTMRHDAQEPWPIRVVVHEFRWLVGVAAPCRHTVIIVHGGTTQYPTLVAAPWAWWGALLSPLLSTCAKGWTLVHPFIRLRSSGAVRRQGLEPRTRGLRVRCSAS